MTGRADPRWRGVALAAAPVALALALRLPGLDWSRPGFFEEAVPLHRAWAMWAWDPSRPFDGNPHYFRYPTLVIYLNLLLQAATYAWLKLTGVVAGTLDFRVLRETDPALFFVPARALSVLFGTATAWMTGRLGRRLDGPLLGTVAAVLVAASALQVDWSQRISVDMPLAFFSAWALLRCVRLAGEPTVRNGALAGLAIGLATSSKYTGAMLAVPLLAAWLLSPRRDGRRAWSALLVAGAAAVAVFALTSPWVVADPARAWRDIASEREHMEVGHFGSAGGAAWTFYAAGLARRLLGPFAAAAALAGIAITALRRDRGAIVVASFVVAYVAVVGSWSMRADRYLLPVIPPLLLFAAVVPREAFRGALRRGAGRGTAVAAAAVLAAVLAAPQLFALPQLYARAARDNRLAAADYVERAFPAGSLIVTEPYGPPLRGTEEMLNVRPEVLAGVRRAEPDRPVYSIITIPMSQVYPETSAPFYDLRLYRDADAIIVTDDIASRYEADPERFPRQVAFYRALEGRFRKVADLGDGPGPRIRIYVDGLGRPSFARRESVEGPVAEKGDPGGLKAGFWFGFGFAYESAGFLPEALTAYALGLKSPLFSAGTFARLALGTTRCLAMMGRTDEAADFLEAAEGAAPWPEDRTAIRGFRGKLPRIPPAP